MISHEETIELILKAQKGDENAKNTLINEHAPLVKSLIKRYKNQNLEYDDLYQLGCVGFTRAINKFDVKYNVQFSTYAVPIILGEIKRQLRDDGYIKVSRATKQRAILIKRYVEKYIAENSTAPKIDDVAKYFDITPQEAVFVMDSIKMPISIYEKTDDAENGQTVCDKIVGQDNEEAQHIDNIILKDLIKSLPEKERKLIILRFFQDRTQTEIAKELQISQVQVSRMETKILDIFKEKLG